MIDRSDLEAVREVFRSRRDALIERFDAQGAGIGKRRPEDSDYVIVVYLKSEDDRPEGDVDVEGIPVLFTVPGRFELKQDRRSEHG